MAIQQTMAMVLVFVSVQVLLMTLMAPVAMAHRPDPLRLFCGMLPTYECAFAVDSAGQRCVLETISGDMDWHVCQTSDILVSEGSPMEYIETDECLKRCGVAKMTVGLSTDALELDEFTSMLCSTECQENCANLVDLYTNLAAGEGKSLKLMCANHHHRSRDMPVRRRKDQEVYADLAAEEPAPALSSGL
ncbi:unnamed protein product [Calypogeia fissa]